MGDLEPYQKNLLIISLWLLLILRRLILVVGFNINGSLSMIPPLDNLEFKYSIPGLSPILVVSHGLEVPSSI